jgi:ElaB/YqjD/DUF883 family membrane-anchored ribosome-binding protein
MRENIDNRSPEEIESDIERTRADFSSTIEAIQQKLTPREMMDHAVDYALSTKPGAFGVNVVNTVRDNPIPIALIGIGVAWLMAANRQSTAHMGMQRGYARQGASFYPDSSEYDAGYYAGGSAEGSGEGLMRRAASRANETAQELKDRANQVGQRISSSAAGMTERVQQAGQSARSRLQETAQEAQARMNELSERSRMEYYRAKDRVGALIDEQPLVVGALGVALGAALGAMLPTTRRENELMGDTRDSLLDRVKETALEQAETVKQSAQRVAQMAMQEAERVKDDVSTAVMQGKEQAGSSSASGSGVGVSPPNPLPGSQGLH